MTGVDQGKSIQEQVHLGIHHSGMESITGHALNLQNLCHPTRHAWVTLLIWDGDGARELLPAQGGGLAETNCPLPVVWEVVLSVSPHPWGLFKPCLIWAAILRKRCSQNRQLCFEAI